MNLLPETDVVVFYTLVAKREDAERIARELVSQKLAACVNILPGVTSIFEWNGVIESTAEWALWIKTDASRCQHLEAQLTSIHPYEIPCLLRLSVASCNPSFNNWVKKQTSMTV